MDILAALSLGIVGSLHCIGMCGPLVMALPGNTNTRWKFIGGRLLYTLGKAITYGAMGALLGIVGKGILMNYQQHISIIAGVMLLLMIAAPISLTSKLDRLSPLKHFYVFVKTTFSKLLNTKSSAIIFFLGMLNGLLPCGLVYTALIVATVVADPWKSALFMMVFGIGTIPALLAVSLAGKHISQKYRFFVSKAVPALSIMLAVLLILRGMNLGIPMISPHVSHSVEHEKSMDCCAD